MDLENSNPEVKDLLNSWIPVTPVKSILTQPQPICAEEQENQLGQAKWLESERFSQEKQLETLSTALLQHTQARSVVACCDSTSNVDLNQGFDKWEEALTRKSRVSVASDTNAMFYNTFSLDSMESSENISLLDLLAFAGAPGAPSISASANAISPGNVDVTLGSQIESNQLESSSCPNSSAKTNRSCNYAPEIPQYENLIPCCPSYDLNSPARTIGEVWGSTISLRFAPITPDQAKRVENRQVSGEQSEYQRTDQAEDTHENEGANGIDRANQLHDEQQSLLLNGSSCAAVSTPIQEDHNPDKGDSNVIDQNRTPQQKQRRKKHRPKVVIEGQPTRTRKPAISELSGKKENPTGKRKYVRRKGLNKSTATPSAEVTSKTTHSETAAPTAKSCRKSLNFNLESREKDENSSVMPPSNVNSESQAQDFYATIQQRSAAAQLGKPIEMIVKKTQVGGIADDLTHSTNQVLEGHISLPERNAPSPLTPTKADPPYEKMKGDVQHECTRGKCQIIFSNQTHDKQGDNVQMMKPITQPAPSPNDSNCSSSASLSKRQEARGLKRDYPYTVDDRLNVMGAHYNSVQAYMPFPVQESNTNRIPAMHFPAVCKKKRTEKGHNSTTSSTLSTVSTMENSATEVTVCLLNDDCTGPFTSKTNCRTLGAQFSTSITPAEAAAVKSAQSKQQTCQSMLALGQKERLTRKRSKGPVRVRDWASFTGIVGYKQVPSSGYVQGFEISNQPNTYGEVQAALSHPTTGTRKRTKRNSFVSSAPSYIYNHQKSHFKSIGPPPNVPWESLSPIDAIVEGLKRLDIDKKTKQVAYQEQTALVPYNMRYLEQNALVLYQRDGTVVPFEGSYDPVKKRRSRAKVDLDEETNRVWKLLLENINSEGIDGTDEEKAKWWEEERRVFRGRADSFIARMHLVQGDRRFSQWKGSVVDSVIGVFLTQNVSDHLSSSAFMSLAARFPLKSKSKYVSCPEENPDSCILDTEYTIKWQEDKSNQPTCNQSSINLHDLSYCEEKSVIDSNESIGSKQSNRNDHERCHESAVNISTTQIIGAAESFMENQIEIDDVLSSQNSVDSSIAQTADRMGAHLLSDSEADQAGGSKSDCFNSFTSFMELLLHKAGTSMLHAADDHVNGIVSSDKMGGHSQAQTEESDSPKENMDNVDHPKASLALITPFSNYQLHTTTQQVVEVGCSQMLEEESFSYNFSKQNEENCKSEQSGMTAGSISETTVQKIASVSFQEMPTFSTENNHTCNNVQRKVNESFQSQSRQVGDSSSNIEAQAQKHNPRMQKVLETPKCLGLDVTESSSTIDNSRNTEASKDDHNNREASKVMKGRMGKEKQKVVDWDSLRKQAQAGSQKRERTSNTMDSLDWEAVRCADVNEIANTIKERGMNNMLAERMKDFLNRIVRDHGSIDLEWLRDVPPDKAKEYLLSIRGLGLKSVECVRLLTLHHLAFPVDTNVGRIAVRLGWVPLQPLPESLQLHLLELYPVLESIQKYLWPRLCKLDQRTLYELHYQMITFGKVFCTKSKPNCNACPMRGECRHFASAFASARLALPGPEEKSIVSAPESKATNQNHMGIIHPLQLPLPQTNEQSGSQPVINNSEPIIEVPATPEPIIEVPATPELENTQIPETDIEDTYEDPEEIPTIKLNIEEFTQNLQNYMQQNMELQECDMSKALVALTPEAASIPMPKLKNVSRLRTEHQVYELPDSHPLLERLDKREPDDPCPYLLAIWTPGETANSIQPPERRCSSQEFGNLCDEMTCFSCNSIREANSQIVRGTLLIPCRTAMRGSFPLNGTYFQVNEVFADHNSSINPIDIPRSWIWNLPRRTVYFGTSIPTIFKGLSTEGIQYCFWRGFVCVRGFDQKTRAPRPLMARLHFPASKLTRTKGKTDDT